uniref:NADH dehydrogenase subunit 6 n=1 Tax=Plegadiphilus threskiornis TaxID=2965265 RepID=UPI0026E3727D|nr:NADH dehydrogenase subunit 6 [Plegadiphilus threskiornis]WIM51528.1 NADH dehydrogenase subunit 6 [Plegadiphilus threskiornis]
MILTFLCCSVIMLFFFSSNGYNKLFMLFFMIVLYGNHSYSLKLNSWPVLLIMIVLFTGLFVSSFYVASLEPKTPFLSSDFIGKTSKILTILLVLSGFFLTNWNSIMKFPFILLEHKYDLNLSLFNSDVMLIKYIMGLLLIILLLVVIVLLMKIIYSKSGSMRKKF